MFKVIANPTFAHDVEVQVPVDGGYESHKLRTRFRVADFDELTGFNLSTAAEQTAYVERIVEGFENVVDGTGEPLAMNDGLRRRLLGMPFVRAAVMRAYEAAMTGARTKN
jgi:hypothetical protein